MGLVNMHKENILGRILKTKKNSTIVVLGQNGEGKSRLLVNLVNQAKYYSYGNVIAVSTSPFDKFPIRTVFKEIEYNYVGVKGGGAGNSILSLINSASLGLLDYHNKNEGDIERILEFLGATSEVEYIFKLNAAHSKVYKQRTLFGKYNYFIKNPGSEAKLLECTDDEFENIETYLHLLSGSADSNNNLRVRLIIGKLAYIRNQYERSYDVNEIVSLLLKFNLIKLIDFKIEKINFGWMSLRLASSGEQCILLSLLGIAANISNNTLILIDEPEISLHPEWQERYISLLMKIFERYHSCLFIIATHSPQMVSKLNPIGSYIYTIQNDELLNAAEYIKRSSDFQLANLFSAPGYKNEYLTRVLISFLTSPEEFMSDDKIFEIKNIISLKKSLDSTDPVNKLISIASKVIARLA
ncbi:AAA family ATPase [Pseudescherichia sp.]|uniref:AAA family ATPase n=1 Tax=Pseudescherichia sp. TaxID=2055881 RepID=UPI00289B2BBF|nr:AAA family ATPase [Pseudescherichia sp.]